MRVKLLASGVGTVLLLFPVTLLLPFITGLLFKERILDISLAYLLPALFSFFIGLLLTVYGGRADRVAQDMRHVEALAVVSIVWVLIAIIGSLPFMLMNTLPNFIDAFFESMSGFTTTGASVIVEIDGLPHSILFWRALTQWLGGLGIIVLMVAIFSMLLGGTRAGRLLMKGEVPGFSSGKIVPRIRDTAKILWGIYGMITILQIILLVLLGVSLYDSVCHTFTTISTGGYGTHTASIGYFKTYTWAPVIELVFVVFMILGSVNFLLHYNFLKGNWRLYFRDTEFRVYVYILITLWGIVALDLAVNDLYSPLEAARASIFNVTSIYSTCGYATEDFNQWPPLSRFIMIIAMLMGGMTGSTSGAIKTARFIIAFKAVSRSLRRIGHPRSLLSIRVGKVIFSDDIARDVGVFIFVYLSMFIFSSFIMTLVGLDVISAISSVATTMGGVGPGLGMVGPATNFASISIPGKVILTFLMWFGRLELITGMVLFLPSTYRS
ncbi:MAG: TrkH family potassium uptake protein [Candidatus Thermoplasmatota archaeon]|nr:TrkH family potassium uptake protein [Candidatus Thermoplasmatota archaeon]